MSNWEIISNPARVYDFVRKYTPVNMVAGSQGLGLLRNGELVAGVIYEGFNGKNVWMHVGAEPGRKWMNRRFLRAAFAYPFLQLGCTRVSGYVEAWNTDARRFDEHLGFKHEATLTGAASDGGDVLLYVMKREECRHVNTQ